MINELSVPPGEIHGTGIIRDKDGNVKGEFTFGGIGTLETAKELAKDLNVPLEIKNSVANELGTRIIPKP